MELRHFLCLDEDDDRNISDMRSISVAKQRVKGGASTRSVSSHTLRSTALRNGKNQPPLILTGAVASAVNEANKVSDENQ